MYREKMSYIVSLNIKVDEANKVKLYVCCGFYPSSYVFSMFISALPDVISSQLGTYAEDTHVNSCLSSNSYTSDKIKLVTVHEN